MHIANPFAGLEPIVAEQYPLKRHTWYRVGGAARYFIRPTSIEELRECVLRCVDHEIPIYVLGLGANLLIRDEGVDGAVIHLSDEAFERVEIDGSTLRVGGGVDLQKLIVRCVREGLAGLETLAGIPGTVGGALRMNAGGKFGDIAQHVASVTTMDLEGRLITRDRDQLAFAYRSSDIAEPLIVEATFDLTVDSPDDILPRYKEVWMYKRNSQPLNSRNSGCIFKNPPGPLGAGALIDRAGLKGIRVGRAEVSAKHANFIVADENCPSDDVLALIELVQKTVAEREGIVLHAEVKIWPQA